MLRALVILFLLVFTAAAQARCEGRDLLPTLPEELRARIEARAAAAPFPEGNLWRAERGGEVVHLVGTFHIGDDRMGSMMRVVAPLIEAADLVLVEVTATEEAALHAAMVADPGLAFLTEPPSLREMLSEAEWALYAAEMEDRGVPSVVAAQFRPWLAFITLTIPACLMHQGASLPAGLDDRVIAHATGSGVPVQALEGHEVLSAIFDTLTPEESLDILRATLMQAELSEDVFATLITAYFAGRHRLIWEFGRSWMPGPAAVLWPPERIDPLYDRLEEALLIRRNLGWLETILSASAEGPLLVAVGAAHLSGPDGLLDLLDRAGFALIRLD